MRPTPTSKSIMHLNKTETYDMPHKSVSDVCLALQAEDVQL